MRAKEWFMINPLSALYCVAAPVTQYSSFDVEGTSVTQLIVAEFDVIFPAVTPLITGAGTAVLGAMMLVDKPPIVIVAIFDSPVQLEVAEHGFT